MSKYRRVEAPREGLRWVARAALTLLLLAGAPTSAAAQTSRAAPEGPAALGEAGPGGAQQMVVAAHPLAARAGTRVLEAGGNALDAAIAAQMVLNVVEPQSSGLGGGGFLLYWNAAQQRLYTYDGRERAPLAARESRFMQADGTPMRWPDAVPTALSVGVPGLVAMLEKAHREQGALEWRALFGEAIALARDGFGVSPRLNGLLARFGAEAFEGAARELYFDEAGRPRVLGEILRNGELAKTFELVAEKGSRGFYEGPVADAMLARLGQAPFGERAITAEDLTVYTAPTRPAVCQPYRTYSVCGMGPPSSGGLTVAQTLGMLEGFSLAGGPDADAVHLILEAEKLAYADRNRYIADTDQVPLPHGYLDPAYLRGRVGLIDPKRALGPAEPGQPPMKRASVYGVDATVEGSGTTQISVVDKDGNAVSMTTSIETAFGSRMMAAGFFLNNQLTDFSFAPRDASGVQIANRPGPGKRPRSSMAPTMIFDADGKLWAVLGTPGGSRIIFYVVKAIAALVDWNMTPADAAALGTFGSRNGPAEVEARADLDDLAAALAARGHEVARPSMTSGLHIVQVRPEGLLGGADPRREGAVFGD